ncbi:MAG: phosphatase PAP2 family protein [Planctomycetes bacterium]|nr:phosphatase PAP2 family protein [Planctomycetota bacterium]
MYATIRRAAIPCLILSLATGCAERGGISSRGDAVDRALMAYSASMRPNSTRLAANQTSRNADPAPPSTESPPPGETTTQPQSTSNVPPGYWRPNLARQTGGELKQFLKRDGWVGFRSAFWNAENALVLAGAMGASVAMREGGVDDAVRRRTVGEFKLGDADETIQIIGHPATHFAGAGLLWLGSAAFQDAREHEVARALGEALIVNGVTTMALKVSTNTRGPDEDNRAWPSGHTSSVFTTAAVFNEYYGPWVGVPSLALAGLVGYQRIDSRVHDFSDVTFGAVLGYVVGTSVARDRKGELPELFGMKVVPYADPTTGASGLALLKSW